MRNALRRIQELVRCGEYSISLHAEEELEADGLSVFDLEHVVLDGFLAEQQRDEISGEWKYLVEGRTRTGRWGAVVAKFSRSGRLYILTAFRL
jgi:uncharacterized protein DUF4258